MPPHLSPQQRDTLAALAVAILEGAPPSHESVHELVARCDARLHTLPPYRRALVGTALDVLGSPLAVLASGQRPRAFASLAPEQQRRCLTAWTDSTLAPLRSAWQTVRRVVCMVHYARPEVAAAIGYDGPFRARLQLRAYEGPLPPGHKETATEPVARGLVTLPGEIGPDPVPPNVRRGASLTADESRSADVVVIGTGAGGAVTAALMAEAGYDVVLLDGGGWHTRSDFTEDEPALTERLFADGGLRTTDDASVSLIQGGTVGGGAQ